MKKNIIKIISIILGILIIGLIIYSVLTKSDGEKFKEEYENYNNVTWANGKQRGKYLKLNIDKKNPIIYLNNDNLIKELTTGNKIIYFGFPDCNWCRNAINILLETAKDNGIEEIYYYNPYNIRKSYEENKQNDESKIYEKLIKEMDKFINDKFKEGEKKGNKRLTVPTVVLVKSGKVKIYHNGTVKSHTDYGKELNKNEKEELYKIYNDMMVELLMCTEETDCNK